MSTPPLHLWAVEARWGAEPRILPDTIATRRTAAIAKYNAVFGPYDEYRKDRRKGDVMAVRVTVTVEG